MVPPPDLDFELRLATFAHVERLAKAAGGLVTSAHLNEGITFRGERVPIWNQQKGIFRPRILRESGAALTIQTSFDSPYDDRLDPNDDRFVYRYRGTDPGHPDNVALRRAMELRRPVLYLIAVEPGGYEPVFPPTSSPIRRNSSRSICSPTLSGISSPRPRKIHS